MTGSKVARSSKLLIFFPLYPPPRGPAVSFRASPSTGGRPSPRGPFLRQPRPRSPPCPGGGEAGVSVSTPRPLLRRALIACSQRRGAAPSPWGFQKRILLLHFLRPPVTKAKKASSTFARPQSYSHRTTRFFCHTIVHLSEERGKFPGNISLKKFLEPPRGGVSGRDGRGGAGGRRERRLVTGGRNRRSARSPVGCLGLFPSRGSLFVAPLGKHRAPKHCKTLAKPSLVR